jgi:hypothetical protein
MPYFHNNNINILFIHIPKTGGTSLEKYFSKKYNIPLNYKSLFSILPDNFKIPNNFNRNIHLQHQTYNILFNYKDHLHINFNNLQIITIVRNPYDRIISDLFYFKLITVKNTPNEVYNIMFQYLHNHKIRRDNHKIPQHLFVINMKGRQINNLIILKTETLTDDMKRHGYHDFNFKENVNSCEKKYDKYLNYNSIKLINNVYKEDFTFFNYQMKIV